MLTLCKTTVCLLTVTTPPYNDSFGSDKNIASLFNEPVTFGLAFFSGRGTEEVPPSRLMPSISCNDPSIVSFSLVGYTMRYISQIYNGKKFFVHSAQLYWRAYRPTTAVSCYRTGPSN